MEQRITWKEYIDRNEFGRYLLSRVIDKKYIDRIMQTMQMEGHKHFREGFMQGLLWAYTETAYMQLYHNNEEKN